MVQPAPEQYFLSPTQHVPNSPLPVLVYRNVLRASTEHSASCGPASPSLTADATIAQLSLNHWHCGGVFKTFRAHHFHSVTHEAYAVFKGRSTLLLGRGPTDTDTDDALATAGGVQVVLAIGDVIVLPAGVAHCSIEADDDYEYVGMYPDGSPQYDNNFCKASPEETARVGRQARAVPVPAADPVYGVDGPLVGIWNDVSKSL